MAQKILIIDDDGDFRKILERKLSSFVTEMEITPFSNLEAARTYLKANHGALNFDLVILDEHLPDGRGMDLLKEGHFEGLAVLCLSSDTSPEIPGSLVRAGANYFLNKTSVTQPLFAPLVLGLIDRNGLRRELDALRIKSTIVETVKTLVGTLRHEINNPLGAVLGAAYLLHNAPDAGKEQKEAATLVENSGKRIKHVLDQLCDTIAIEPVTKADQRVFHIPGDKPWEER